MNVLNRSDDVVVYAVPEQNIRRVFEIGEEKTNIDEKELNALVQTDGGRTLLNEYLMVEDPNWVDEHLGEVPIEYFWKFSDIKSCMLFDTEELFKDTLEFAPEGVIDVIKRLAYETPLADLNKIKAIYERTGFDVQAALELNKDRPKPVQEKKERLRKKV